MGDTYSEGDDLRVLPEDAIENRPAGGLVRVFPSIDIAHVEQPVLPGLRGSEDALDMAAETVESQRRRLVPVFNVLRGNVLGHVEEVLQSITKHTSESSPDCTYTHTRTRRMRSRKTLFLLIARNSASASGSIELTWPSHVR